MIWGLQPAALRTRYILASNTATIWVKPAMMATSPMPASNSPSARLTPLLLRSGCPSAAMAQMREVSQMVPLSMYSPSSSKNGNTSRNMFGPVVGSKRSDPQYSPVYGSTDIKYSGFSSSKASRSRPSFTTTSQPSLSENTLALLRNIASISLGNNDDRVPSITFNIAKSPFLRDGHVNHILQGCNSSRLSS